MTFEWLNKVPDWEINRLEKRHFAFAYDDLYFIVQRWGEHELQGEDVSKAYRRKEDVTKKLFQLWKDAKDGRGKWWGSDGEAIYVVAIYDHDPREDGVFVGEISSTLWAQLVSGLIAATKERRKVQI